MKKIMVILAAVAVILCNTVNTEYVKSEASYTVQPGDTLWYVAGQYFGRQDKIDHFGEFQWIIREANADKFAGGRKLQPGDVLIIPLEREKTVLAKEK